MTEKTIDRIESKLDKLSDDITTIKISVAKSEEHLKTLNGKVKQQRDFCSTTTGGFGKRLGMVEKYVWLAMGGIAVLGVLGYTKSIGIW